MNELIMTQNVKMTSLDIEELTGKLHKHIMRDIRQEIKSIGEMNNGSIFGLVDYIDNKGETRPCYEFGRAGAMQIAMRYDAKVRYKVIQRLEQLEAEVKNIDYPKQTNIITKEINNTLKESLKNIKMFGVKGRSSYLYANKYVKEIHGIDCMKTIGLSIDDLPQDKDSKIKLNKINNKYIPDIIDIKTKIKEEYLIPTELGKLVNKTPIQINNDLEKAGLQTYKKIDGHKYWTESECGKPYCYIRIVNLKNGIKKRKISWSVDVLNVIYKNKNIDEPSIYSNLDIDY